VTEREPTKLGAVLRTAREARFIDLARVERDTKIRVHYLAALERGDYRELPPAVYAKGLLRNYGLYLGLDPEYLVDLYRLESGALVDRPMSAIRPRPVTERQRRPVVVSSGAVVAAILSLLVLAFVVYVVAELATYGRIPALRITDPAADMGGYTGVEYTIRGQTEPNASVATQDLSQNPSTTADAQGVFSVTVQLLPGANVVTVVATDPLTGRKSAAVRRTITVVPKGASPQPSVGQPPSAVH
jgi:cytoskeletal protein RodZ